MSVKTTHSTENVLHFCSFTCFKWISLFELVNGYDCVYKWFTYLKERKDVGVVSFVIMPNHVHVILHLPDSSLNLNKIIGNGKRFMAYALIEKLESQRRYDLLDELYGNVTWRQRKKGQKHRVFEESFDAKPVYTDYFLKQKMDYIHHNPVRGKWRLVDDYTDYPHSSAGFYEKGKVFFFAPKHYHDL